MKLLHLDSSILGDNSASRLISADIVDRIVALHPGIEVIRRDLVADPLPHLDLAAFEDAENSAELRDYLAADIVVIGVGFYNFTVPSQLKAWIDRIVVRGKTFAYGESGPVGLAPNKRVIVALASGGVYEPGTPRGGFDHARSLLSGLFGFLGVTTEFVIAGGLALGGEQRQASIDHARTQARQLAA